VPLTTRIAGTTSVDPRDDAGWADLARCRGTLFTSPPWIRAISAAFSLSIMGRVSTVDGVTTQALAFADIDDPGGRRRSSLPFSDFSEPLAIDDAFDWSNVGEDIIARDVPYAVRLRRSRSTVPDDRLTEVGTYAWHEIDVSRSTDDMWLSLAPHARQAIRRAQRDGAVALVTSGANDVDEFRRLHVQLRREKFRMLAQPPEFFDELTNEFAPDDIAVVSVRNNGAMVGAILLLRWADVAYYKFSASTRDGVAMHANDLCMWTAMQYARDVWGSHALDLGVSDLDQPGLMRYKQKYATTTCEVARYVSLADVPRTREHAFRSQLNDEVARVLADGIPDDVSVEASSRLYRHFC
jgi:CelD/BcsL family acetyltransferase involved in cellulose biosynthesis